MTAIQPCGLCLRGEYADEDSDGLAYIARLGARVAHVKRPSESEGQRGWAQTLVWSTRRGPYTYCGKPIGADWQEVAV